MAKKTTRKKPSRTKAPGKTAKTGKANPKRRRPASKTVGKPRGQSRKVDVAGEDTQPSTDNGSMMDVAGNGNGGDANEPTIPDTLPVLPIRGTVVFPGTIMPLSIGRPSTRRLLDESLPKSKMIALLPQRDEEEEDPDENGLYQIGVAAMVLKLVRQPDETVSVIVHGLQRIRLVSTLRHRPYIKARIETIDDRPGSGRSFEAGLNQLREQAMQLIELTANSPEQAQTVLMNIESPSNLADFLAANINLDVQQKQDLLEEFDVAKRIRQVHRHVASQLEIARLQQKIQHDVQSTIGDSQRRFFLREQLKAIQKELGEDPESSDQLAEQLRERIEEADPPEAVMTEAKRELDRLAVVPPVSPEHSVITTYLELIADLPWNTATRDNLDLVAARKVLDRDHFDLDKVKRRLIEYLAVRKLNPDGRAAILCLVGPPGVGKTSLGQSVADALGREFARISLGGIRDEAEIRGHRRTYIGAMPGRIINAIRRAGANNPVIMLDEVDKLGADFRGDPASALLELLDPRQNHAFVDRYLDVPFDLSQVLFICTANYMGNVPPALADRLETIDLPGYTDHDKLAIARKYLVPRQLKENGLRRQDARFLAAGLRQIIESYTREAGVRELERQIGSVCRSIAADITRQDTRSNNGTSTGKSTTTRRKNAKTTKTARIDESMVSEILGPAKYQRELDIRSNSPGVALGLAYTPVGGEVLFIEAAQYPGKGKVTLTGQIGDVMKESATAAMSLFKTRAASLGYDPQKLGELDLHIHVPAGAVPKDGPSAGVAMMAAISSLLLGKSVTSKLAMTGEITLRGRVLPVGGIKEKTLAASRAGVKTVILPKRNESDLEEADPRVRQKLKFIFADTIDDVLEAALNIKPTSKDNGQ